MAHFSDRVVSFNKLIIAAAIAYAGAVGFAHAADVNLQHAQCYADVAHTSDVQFTLIARGELKMTGQEVLDIERNSNHECDRAYPLNWKTTPVRLLCLLRRPRRLPQCDARPRRLLQRRDFEAGGGEVMATAKCANRPPPGFADPGRPVDRRLVQANDHVALVGRPGGPGLRVGRQSRFDRSDIAPIRTPPI
jgi:hypothetical protein